MIQIPLPCGLEALIDDIDANLVAGFSWRSLHAKSGLTYVHAWNKSQHFYMHRLITGVDGKHKVDHVNRNGLDNQRHNLRICTSSQNGANRIADNRTFGKTSQYKGVYFDKSRQKWSATIHVNGNTRALGRFGTEIEAATAYDRAATETWGRFALLNLH